MKISVIHFVCLVAQSGPTLCNPMDCSPPGFSVHEDSPGKDSEVGCHALLQGVFPTQGSNPGLLHFRQILYHLSHQGSPWILEWVAYPFSRGISRPRNWTRVSCIAGGFFTNWAIREALFFKSILKKCFKHIPTISSIPFLVYYPKRKHAAAAKSLQLCPTVRPHWQQHRSIQRLVHTDPWMFIVILFVKTRN